LLRDQERDDRRQHQADPTYNRDSATLLPYFGGSNRDRDSDGRNFSDSNLLNLFFYAFQSYVSNSLLLPLANHINCGRSERKLREYRGPIDEVPNKGRPQGFVGNYDRVPGIDPQIIKVIPTPA
jgi:hypothetical protein